MKNMLTFSIAALVNLIANFTLFSIHYNKLATPYINEEQRVENADYIFTITLSSFAATSILFAIAAYFYFRRKQTR